MKTFYLKRDFTDEVRQRIAEGVLFSDGTGAILWYQRLDHTFFRSDRELRRQLRDLPGVELVYAFQTKVPEPKTCKVSLTLNGKDLANYLTRQLCDDLNKEISSGGSL